VEIFLLLRRDNERANRHVPITGFVGCKPEPCPWDEKALSRSERPSETMQRAVEFRKADALAYDRYLILARTETNFAPFE